MIRMTEWLCLLLFGVTKTNNYRFRSRRWVCSANVAAAELAMAGRWTRSVHEHPTSKTIDRWCTCTDPSDTLSAILSSPLPSSFIHNCLLVNVSMVCGREICTIDRQHCDNPILTSNVLHP